MFKDIANIEGYFPNILRDIREFKEMAKTENNELTFLWEYINRTFANQYIENMDEYGVLRWEEIINIVPAVGETIEERKFRIYVFLKGRLPYTIRTLDDLIKSIVGSGNYEIVLDHDNYVLTVKLAVIAQFYYDIMYNMLKTIVPANLIVDLQQQYNTHQALKVLKHSELKENTHYNVRRIFI